MDIEQFYRLSQLLGEEIQKQSTNYRRAIIPEERLLVRFWCTSYKKSVEDKKGILDIIGATLFFLSVLDSNIIYSLLTYSMVPSPSWEANWFAASQEIPRISRNPKVHYRTHVSATCLYPGPAQSSPYTHIAPPGDPS